MGIDLCFLPRSEVVFFYKILVKYKCTYLFYKIHVLNIYWIIIFWFLFYHLFWCYFFCFWLQQRFWFIWCFCLFGFRQFWYFLGFLCFQILLLLVCFSGIYLYVFFIHHSINISFYSGLYVFWCLYFLYIHSFWCVLVGVIYIYIWFFVFCFNLFFVGVFWCR